jgi:L-2-hydroxyglutarate oxidase LhgO
VAAFHSPETGIIDSHRYMLALQGDMESEGAVLALNTPVERLARSRAGTGAGAWAGWKVDFGGREPGSLIVDAVVNAAGHGAQKLGLATQDYPAARVPRLVLAKGNYFAFAGRPAFSRLIYPVPVPGGLGIHVTLDLAGRMRFGPDVQWTDRYDYDVDAARAASFYPAIRTYWPALPDASLVPDYSGIRPKLSGPGEAAADFMIDGPAEHGLAGLVHLFGIESPGLTASLSIAEQVVESLGQ